MENLVLRISWRFHGFVSHHENSTSVQSIDKYERWTRRRYIEIFSKNVRIGKSPLLISINASSKSEMLRLLISTVAPFYNTDWLHRLRALRNVRKLFVKESETVITSVKNESQVGKQLKLFFSFINPITSQLCLYQTATVRGNVVCILSVHFHYSRHAELGDMSMSVLQRRNSMRVVLVGAIKT